jgi:hypothetical protein
MLRYGFECVCSTTVVPGTMPGITDDSDAAETFWFKARSTPKPLALNHQP